MGWPTDPFGGVVVFFHWPVTLTQETRDERTKILNLHAAVFFHGCVQVWRAQVRGRRPATIPEGNRLIPDSFFVFTAERVFLAACRPRFGLVRGARRPIRWRQSFRSVSFAVITVVGHGNSGGGIFVAGTTGIFFHLLYYTLIKHIRVLWVQLHISSSSWYHANEA